MEEITNLEVRVAGMDCAECTMHVRQAIAALPGVRSVDVFLASEKAQVSFDPARVDLAAIRTAVEGAGYAVPASDGEPVRPAETLLGDFQRRLLSFLAVVFGAVLFVVVAGEWLGLFEDITARVPWPIGLAIVIAGGYPVFLNVARAAWRRQVISHTLMSVGVIAALVVGQWATAAVVVLFMRLGDYAEHFTTDRARRAVKDLTAAAPQTARVERDGREVEVPATAVRAGETVIVRPGERIPVDGEVVDGQATVDQAAITGEAMPVETGPGSRVYAATTAQLGFLRIRTTGVGAATTFGRVIKMVEEAEAHRADVQRVADRVSAYYLPVVAAIAALTFLLRRDPLATAAVLVVACSCSFALATPIAMLASIGAGARRGLLIKGGRYLELLARADVLLIDKTGTLTLGKPEVTDVVALDGLAENELMALAAAAERYSEHPLAEAVRVAAVGRGLPLAALQGFEALPGLGVRATVDGHTIEVGSRRMLAGDASLPQADLLEHEGKTLLLVNRDGALAGLVAVADSLRGEVPEALAAVRALGVRQIELLTGDNERTARALAERLGIAYRANLLPEDKIRIVKEYQARGHVVAMVGDGVNDAPALAQAEVGIAMGAAGSGVAFEAAHIVLMREDWGLVPEVFRIARRTMRVVRMNLAFTTLYNLVGLSLAAFGILPPILAAAAQSLPDLGILGNSTRLLRQR
jgi:Cu+-exporting ATPase